jgi:phosphoenolpyruvate synthase/pyruvate phosphate dikinase
LSEAQPANIKAVECRFAVHCKTPQSTDDLHLIKEQITYEKDGKLYREPNVRFVKNYKRPFYITSKGKQVYKDYKEWEKAEHLDRFMSTQAQLTDSVAKALGKPWFKGSLKDLCESPYVFGADILSTSLIKQSYSEKYPGFAATPYSLAAFDAETDVIHGHGQIMILGITFKERIYVAVQKSFVDGYANVEQRLHELCEKHLGEILKKRNAKIEFGFFETEIEVVKACMAKAHEWMPDWLVAWNMEFDIDKIVAACNRAGVAPEDILSDPKVPKEFRHFRFKKGPAKKVMASGRILNFKPSQRWHTVFCPASFYFMDAMCAYRQVRQGSPEEVNYKLDYILKKNKLGGKLEFPEADHIDHAGLEWHKFMQSKYPLEYVVYNIYDCIGIELLDEKTRDLQMALPNFAGFTDFQHFNSLPRKTMNDLHFFVGKRGLVPGSTASEMATEMDEMTTDVKGWIVMLPSHLVEDNGIQIVEEHPDLRTNIRIGVADLDIEGAYPTNELVMNVSKETTSKELIKVQGVPDRVARMQTINFSGGPTNAVEFCTTMYGMPALDTLLAEFKAHMQSKAAPTKQLEAT